MFRIIARIKRLEYVCMKLHWMIEALEPSTVPRIRYSTTDPEIYMDYLYHKAPPPPEKSHPNKPDIGCRPCKAVVWEKGEGHEVKGVFHRWGENFEEFEAGPGNYTVAVVELEDGKIVICPAEQVQFLDRMTENILPGQQSTKE